MSEQPRDPSETPATERVQVWWFGLMLAGGIGFGLFGDRRPFGNDVLAHPFVVFFVLVAATLLSVRIALQRPLPEFISERTLLLGCVIGAAGYLAGNLIAVHVLGR